MIRSPSIVLAWDSLIRDQGVSVPINGEQLRVTSQLGCSPSGVVLTEADIRTFSHGVSLER